MAIDTFLPKSPAEVAVAALVLLAGYTLTLIIYRLTLHPYAKYPGPLLAKISTLYATYYAYTGDIHLDVQRCHEKYGKFVRYAPNSLIVNSPTGYHDIYGNLKKVKKAPSYGVHGPGNLLGIQDKKDYARKKKIFQQGFSDAALRRHEPKVVREIEIFCEQLLEDEPGKTHDGDWSTPKDMNAWCMYLTTDVIAKVVFTTSWDLLTSPANRGVRDTMATIVRLIGILHQNAILRTNRFLVLLFLRNLAWSSNSLRKYTKSMIARSNELRKDDPSVNDYYGQFTSATDPDSGKPALTWTDVRINSANFIIAGSDTTASSMAATFFYLSRDPAAYAQVAAEVRATFSSVDEIRTGPKLNSCVRLRAALNEAMRVCPVATQPLWRAAEPGGCIVDGEYIPEGCVVGSSIFMLHRNPDVFPNPSTYDMDRWLPRESETKKDEEAEAERLKEMQRSYAPFSVGPRQCIAKNFALMELTLTMATVFYKMDFAQPPGEDGHVGEGKPEYGPGRNRKGELQFKSYFTSALYGPMVQFKRR